MNKIDTFTIGTDRGNGNIIGVQPYMDEVDYSSAEFFRQKIHSYLNKAKQCEFLNESSVVVFPEYIGTWLVGINSSAHKYNTINKAMIKIILKNPIVFLSCLLKFKTLQKAIFNSKANQISETYNNIFSNLAKEFGVTIIAGSVLLPNPKIINNKLTVTLGDLYNTTIVYKPNGQPYESIVKKIYLVKDEAKFTQAGKIDELKVIEHKIGNLAIFICADSWFEPPYEIAKRSDADFLLVPSYLYPNNSWNNHWKSDTENKTDLSEKEAWLKYAMNGKIGKTKMKIGLNVFLRGNFWGIGSDGETTVIYNNKTSVIKGDNILTNIWI